MRFAMLSILGVVTFTLGSIKALEHMHSYEPIPLVEAVDLYNMKIRLDVPQVVDNSSSEGKRVYRMQNIWGNMEVQWLSDGTMQLAFSGLVNRQFFVSGKAVTYKGYESQDMMSTHFVWIGNNKTGKFATPCLSFFLELLPSYALTEVSEDNSFYLLMAGKGVSKYKRTYDAQIATRIKGYAAGTQGCGCMDYSHKSPTRIAGRIGPTDGVSDVVATMGTWQALWKNRTVIVR